MNQVTVAGHLGSDPEVRFVASGQKVTTLRVAARVRKTGKDETIWWRITIWGEQFDKIIPYFKKGSPIIAQGEIDKSEIYTNREGKPQISMGITAHNIMFSPFGRAEQTGIEERQLDNQLKEDSVYPKSKISNEPFDAEEEIPF